MTRAFVLLLLAGASVSAQDAAAPASRAIKFSPFHMIGFYPTIQMAYEHPLGRYVSLQADAGYVIRYDNLDDNFANKRGVKLKLESRFYFERGDGAYVAPEVYMNAVNFDRKESREECYDLDCQIVYRRTYRYKVKYREPGFGFKFGFVRRFGDFMIDMNYGMAVRFVEYRKPSLTRSFRQIDDGTWLDIPNERNRMGLMPLLGLRLGYRI